MNIEMPEVSGKAYQTKSGLPARILCTDAGGKYPIAALVRGSVERYTEQGSIICHQHPFPDDLIEVSPYADFKRDDKVMVRNQDGEP